MFNYFENREEGKDQETVHIKYHTWPGTPYGKVQKAQENKKHKRAKRLTFS